MGRFAGILTIAAGRKEGNLEDQLRVANELLRGFEILQKKPEAEALRAELKNLAIISFHSFGPNKDNR